MLSSTLEYFGSILWDFVVVVGRWCFETFIFLFLISVLSLVPPVCLFVCFFRDRIGALLGETEGDAIAWDVRHAR